MGIHIHLSISKSVTKKEWASVYKETLSLVHAFPLSERRKVPIRGIKTICVVPTEERQDTYGRYTRKTRTGWSTDGDYETLCIAEEYFLPKKLVKDEDYDPDAPDAMYCMLPAYLDYDWNDLRFHKDYELWGAKTQGEPYHMYLLAIGCLIESRLGQKAYVYGDITRGQCRKAVEMANRHLKKKIDLPASCDQERLLERIKTLPISEAEMLKAYTGMFLGTQDAAFGSALRSYFSEDAFDEYWKKRLGSYSVTTRGFTADLNDYLLWGFDFEKLSGYVSFKDSEGKDHYDDFVESIMAAKLYIKEKDCRDTLKIDPEDEEPYGIPTLFAEFVYGGAVNRKVDRYIPLESIRKALISSIGDKCDVNRLIDQYLEQDEEYQKLENTDYDKLSEEDYEKIVAHDPSAVFTQVMDIKRTMLEEAREAYAISDFEDIPYYKAGDSIDPDIIEEIGEYFSFHRGLLKEEKFAELMKASPKSRCEWLVSENRYVLLRDKDWDKIFGDITDNPASFARYYPLVRIKIMDEIMRDLIRTTAINDDFYQFELELERKNGEEKKNILN